MQFVLTVLSNASVLVPLVLGVSLVYRISGVIVFAAGQIVVLAGMLYGFLDTPLYIRIPAVVFVGMVASVLIYLAIVPAQRIKVSPDAISLATFGAAYVIEYLASQFLGLKVFSSSSWVPGTVSILGAGISVQRLLIMGVAAVLTIVVILFIDRTLIGRAMEATAFDPLLGQLYGLRIQRFRLLAWIIAGGCISFVGIFQVTLASVSQPTAVPLLTLALAGAVVGGLGGLYTGLAGAVVVALVQAAAAQFISSDLQVAIVFAALFVVLIFRPGGLFANARNARRA
jgi:branched-chain amino acid transport system permease protein